MTNMFPIIIRAPQDGWTKATRKPTFVQPSADGVAAHYEHLEHRLLAVAICTKDVVQARVAAILGSFTAQDRNSRKRLPVLQFQSATVGADTGGLRSFPPRAARLRFNSFGHLARWSIPPRFKPAKQPRGGFTKSFDLSFAVLVHGHNHAARSFGNVRKVIGEIRNVIA